MRLRPHILKLQTQTRTMSEAEEVTAAFKLVCRKCGSENTVVDIARGTDYGGETGYSPGYLTVGRNGCAANDIYVTI